MFILPACCTSVYLVGNDEKDSKVGGFSVICCCFVKQCISEHNFADFREFEFFLLKCSLKKFIRRPQPEPHCHAALASAAIKPNPTVSLT
jgi:hypothetical protein